MYKLYTKVTQGEGAPEEAAVAWMGLGNGLGEGCGHRSAVRGGDIERRGAPGNRGAAVAVVVSS